MAKEGEAPTQLPPRSRALNALLGLAAFVVIVAGLRAGSSLATPFLLALFLAVLLAPPLFALQRRGVPTSLALLVVVAGAALVLGLLGLLVGASVTDFTQSLPEYQAKLRAESEGFAEWLAGRGLPVSEQELRQRFDAGAVFSMVGSVVAGLGNVLTNAVLILLTVIFILLEAATFPRKLAAVVRDPEASFGRFVQVRDNVQRYLAIKTGTSLATGLLVFVWLLVLGVDFPLLWALLAFLLNFVPSIGSIIAAVPAILLALVQLGVGPALLTGGGYLVINVLIGNGIEPRLFGRGTGLSTLVVFLSLVFWGWVLGPVGMLLSVPLTMTAKVALESYEDTRWVGLLLGPAQAAEAASATPAGEVGAKEAEAAGSAP